MTAQFNSNMLYFIELRIYIVALKISLNAINMLVVSLADHIPEACEENDKVLCQD